MSARVLRLATPHADDARTARDAQPWDVPVPLAEVMTARPFPVDVYPAWLADMVTGVAEFTQTDTAMAGTVALAVLSACAGGRLEVEPVAGWREPVNVYVAVIADPGESKSPVHGALTRPLVTAQQTLGQRIASTIAENAALKDIAARQAEQAKAVAAKADRDKRDNATAEAVAAALAAESITVPDPPRLLADDSTPEKLIGLMAANGGRIAIISDEGGIFDTLAGRYNGTPNLDPYLKGHSGQPLYYDRQGREGAYIAKPALTVGVMAQPSVLRKFGGNADLFGRGLPARFLFTLPQSLAGWRDFTNAQPVPETVADTYSHRIHDLAATFAEWTDPEVVTLTDNANTIRTTLVADIETQLRPGGTLHEVRFWANKLRGAVLRIAGLLHVAHHPADAWRRPIDADRMAEAVRLLGFFVDHYRAALHTITADDNTHITRYILDVLITKKMNTFTRRDLHRRVSRQLPKAAQVATVLDELTQLGWVRPTEAGGYELHPHASEYAEGVDTLTTDPTDDISPAHTPDEAVNGAVDTPLTGVDNTTTGERVSTPVNALSTAPLTPRNMP